ncbi:MAG: IclR family transcriptional regulator [Brachymonas sp.]|jgi:IclR family acetate operon transcriptional repressor
MEVKQISNLLQLLQYFAQRQRPASLADIVQDLGWPRSSTHNILMTLLAQGYLYEPQARKGYYPSGLWQPLIARIEQAAPLPPALHSLLAALAQQTGETAVLAGISGADALFLEVVESPHAVRYTAQVGKRVPLQATATGRALLAQLPAAERLSLLRKAHFERYTANTLMSVQAVEEEIARSAHRGWFEGAAEYSQDLGGIALPLACAGRQLALLLAGPMSRMQGKQAQIAKILQQEIAARPELSQPQATWPTSA